MNKEYREPEFKVVLTGKVDVLTASTDPLGWGTGGAGSGAFGG